VEKKLTCEEYGWYHHDINMTKRGIKEGHLDHVMDALPSELQQLLA
jgi:uncharacterized protein (DUF2267 family)